MQITSEFAQRHEAKTVVEMKHFVQKIPRIQAAKQSLALRMFSRFQRHRKYCGIYSRYVPNVANIRKGCVLDDCVGVF